MCVTCKNILLYWLRSSQQRGQVLFNIILFTLTMITKHNQNVEVWITKNVYNCKCIYWFFIHE